MTFAIVVPEMVIAAASEWLFSVPMELLTGHPYWWNPAMLGGFGPLVGANGMPTSWGLCWAAVCLDHRTWNDCHSTRAADSDGVCLPDHIASVVRLPIPTICASADNPEVELVHVQAGSK